jgi:aldehyde dehydrogenase (NAD+)
LSPAARPSDRGDAMLIGGDWITGEASVPHAVINPATGVPVMNLRPASTSQAALAVAAARHAFDHGPWRDLGAAERGRMLHAVADQIEDQCERIAQCSLQELGQPVAATRGAVRAAADLWRRYADIAGSYQRFEDRPVDARRKARVVREPVGVVLAITPWNSPLLLSSLKIAPALAVGCTVVLKPPLEGPLTMPFLGEAVQQAGIPDGVFNVVYADAAVSAEMVADPRIDMVSFTGSSAVGSQIMRACATNITRLALELGGKSAAIVTADVKPAEVVPMLIACGGLGLAGQVCTSRSRVLVPREQHQTWRTALAEALQSLRVGDPADPAVDVGPLATERQRDRVERYIEAGKEEGAELVCGGDRVPELDGWFIRPALFDRVTPKMRIAQEEIFGPVLSLMTYEDLDDAVAIANDSEYGLAGSIFTGDIETGYAIARRIRTGTFQVNTTGRAIDQPFGGVKRSGLGREGGIEGLEAFLETRQIQFPAGADLPALPGPGQ